MRRVLLAAPEPAVEDDEEALVEQQRPTAEDDFAPRLHRALHQRPGDYMSGIRLGRDAGLAPCGTRRVGPERGVDDTRVHHRDANTAPLFALLNPDRIEEAPESVLGRRVRRPTRHRHGLNSDAVATIVPRD